MDGLLDCGLVEEAQERIEAGCPERFDAVILSIAVTKLRSRLAAAEQRLADHDALVDRGRALVAAHRREAGVTVAGPRSTVSKLATRRTRLAG